MQRDEGDSEEGGGGLLYGSEEIADVINTVGEKTKGKELQRNIVSRWRSALNRRPPRTLSEKNMCSERQETRDCGFRLFHYFVCAKVTRWCWGLM